MTALPARNILDGTALPSTSTMKTALGQLRDYLSEQLGATGNVATSYRNRLINGGMGIDQRNAAAAQTITAAAALAYTVDRWYAYCTGANVTGQQVAGTAPNQYNYRFTGAASVTKIGFAQRIEAASSQDLAGTTATFSVDLANSLLTTVTWTAWRANSNDAFGTLASPTRTQIGTGTITVTSTLTRYSGQITVPAAATTGIEIEFSVGAQTSGTWTIGRVQLEPGATATPFELRPIGMELALCQRYFESSFPIGVAPAQNAGSSGGTWAAAVPVGASTSWMTQIPYRVTKRTNSPAIVFYNPSAANAQVRNNGAASDCTATATYAGTGDAGFSFSFTTPVGATSGQFYLVNWSSSIEL